MRAPVLFKAERCWEGSSHRRAPSLDSPNVAWDTPRMHCPNRGMLQVTRLEQQLKELEGQAAQSIQELEAAAEREEHTEVYP